MARRRRKLIAGEELPLLIDGLHRAFKDGVPTDDGMVYVEIRAGDDASLAVMRAVMRIEAELLRNDARQLRRTETTWRTPDRRRFDAMALLAERVVNAATADSTRRTA